MAFPDLNPLPNTSDPTNFAAYFDALLGKLPAWDAEASRLAASMAARAAGGAVSLQYAFSTTTADADPGAGVLRLDNATQNLATTLRMDLVGSDGAALSGVLALLDDSTSTNKGYATIHHADDPTKFLIFSISALASPAGYKNVTVVCAASSAANPFANGDPLLFDFTPTGDKGDTGAPGAVTVVRSARTANTTLTAADKGKWIDATANSWTQLYDDAATLGSGWFVYFSNSGTGVVTHDPNAAQTIGGVATAAMNGGDVWLVQSDGANLNLLRLKGTNDQIITSGTGNFTVPAGVYRIWREIWGGGGGGAVPNNNSSPANAGASGGYSAGWLSVTPGQVIAYAIGAAGVGATVSDADGTAGGNTTFGVLTANGGAGGVRGTNTPAAGGSASGGDFNIDGQPAIMAPLSAGFVSRGGSAPRGGTGGYCAYDGTTYTVKAPVGPGAGGYGGRSPGGIVTAAANGNAGQIVITWG